MSIEPQIEACANAWQELEDLDADIEGTAEIDDPETKKIAFDRLMSRRFGLLRAWEQSKANLTEAAKEAGRQRHADLLARQRQVSDEDAIGRNSKTRKIRLLAPVSEAGQLRCGHKKGSQKWSTGAAVIPHEMSLAEVIGGS